MSTVAKGNAFESRVFRAIEDELRSNRLGLSPATAKLFAKKGYYSRDRASEIIVDISIEVWPKNADRWSILWICECKDYSGTVPVSDIEEFHAKLNQISGANRKGVVAVSGALQESALKYAKANGIGVIRLLPNEQIHHVSYDYGAYYPPNTHHVKPMDIAREIQQMKLEIQLINRKFHQALTQPDFVGRNRFYASYAGDIYGDWESLLKKMLH